MQRTTMVTFALFRLLTSFEVRLYTEKNEELLKLYIEQEALEKDFLSDFSLDLAKETVLAEYVFLLLKSKSPQIVIHYLCDIYFNGIVLATILHQKNSTDKIENNFPMEWQYDLSAEMMTYIELCHPQHAETHKLLIQYACISTKKIPFDKLIVFPSN